MSLHRETFRPYGDPQHCSCLITCGEPRPYPFTCRKRHAELGGAMLYMSSVPATIDTIGPVSQRRPQDARTPIAPTQLLNIDEMGRIHERKYGDIEKAG